jgi:acetyl/propionyl-CoA carboxylase alpha subunit
LRVVAGVAAGRVVTVYYDSMLAKVIAWGPDRATAIGRLDDALAGALVGGVQTNLPLLLAIERSPAFRAGETTTRFLEEHVDTAALGGQTVPDDAVLAVVAHDLAAGRNWRSGGVGVPIAVRIGGREVRASATLDGEAQHWTVAGDVSGSIAVHPDRARDGAPPRALVAGDGPSRELLFGGRRYLVEDIAPPSAEGTHASAEIAGTVTAPMPGKVLSIAVREGEHVEARTLLIVLEAMKMEHRIEAPAAGTVAELFVTPGELVTGGARLVHLRARE